MSVLFRFFIYLLLPFLAVLFPAVSSYAHHSFAPYDIRKPIEITGTVDNFSYRNPHARLILIDEDGVSWDIEVPNRQWGRAGLERDAIEGGDKLIVRVFPARNDSPKGALSGFTKNDTYYSITEEIRQRSGVEAAERIAAGEAVEDVVKDYPEPERGVRVRAGPETREREE